MAKKEEKLQAYSELVKAISFSLKQFRLYSAQHPITKQALTALDNELKKYFETSTRISFGALHHQLIINGEMAGEKDLAAVDFAKELERLGVEGFSIDKGMEIQEMTSFLMLMAARSKSLEGQGGFKGVFEKSGFKHVQLNTGKYELVEEGEKVTDKNAGAGSASAVTEQAPAQGQVTSIVDILQRIRHGDQEVPAAGSGKGGGIGLPVNFDCEKVLTQLEKSPQEVAQLTLEGAQDAASVEAVIRKIIKFLIEGLLSFLVESGKDITKALEKLSKELEKSLGKISDQKPEFAELKKKIPQIFEEAGDDLRIHMMVQTYQRNPADAKTHQKMAAKLFKDEDVRQKLKGPLASGLQQVGMPADQFDALFGKIEERAAAKKSRVTIDAEELAEMKRKADSFDKELKKQLKDVQSKFEREKKIILDEKERVDTVIRNLAEGVLVVDKKGNVVLMNPAAERLLGVNQSDKQGKPVTEGLKDEHIVAMTAGDLQDSEENVSKKVELISFNDANKRVLQASTAVIENEDGHTVGMVSVLSDVTRQKQVEELKSQFVANVSHELRSPLVAIQKSLSMMLQKELGELTPEQEKFTSIAFRNIERLSRLINDLLDVSKLEAKKMVLALRAVSVKELIEQTVATFTTWAADKKVKFEVRFLYDKSGKGTQLIPVDDLPQVPLDPDRMTQVLTNLVSNALKYSPEGGTITIETRGGLRDPKISAEECMEVRVSDNGIGIAPADQTRIFDKFVQVSLVKPEGVSSTGLGLTIAKEIVEIHHGKIWVESETGKGSSFVFRIPMKPNEAMINETN